MSISDQEQLSFSETVKNAKEDAAKNLNAEDTFYRNAYLDLMDNLFDMGFAIQQLSGMCSVLRLGLESSEFCDGRDAASSMWIIEETLDRIKKDYVDSTLKANDKTDS